MKIITVSREFGSGGRELGKRLSDILGYDYYDNEIITAVAKNKGLDPGYVEQALNDHGWLNFPITFGGTLTSAATVVHSSRVELIVEQKNVIESIAALGKDFVIVGRNADVILKDYSPFNIFVCADTESKLRRCKARASGDEDLSDKELLHRMKDIDKTRKRTREIICESEWGDPKAYHLTVNTSGREIKQLAPMVADYALKWFEGAK